MVVSGTEVDEDETVDGIDFRLEKAGEVTGIVVGPDGQPVDRVSVFFRDSAGGLVSAVSSTTTNAAGEFRRAGLAPGDYEISLRSASFASNDGARVRVVSEEAAEVRLTLEVGTTMVVTLTEEGDSVPRARYQVLDANGRDVGGMMTQEQMRSTFNEGGRRDEQRIGPFPPGRYVVRATLADGRQVERSVRLSGRQSEKRVRLKLKP